jgi:hypothetical protein
MAGMNMRKAIGLAFLFIFLYGSAFGEDSFGSKGIYVGVSTGIGFPYSWGFIRSCHPAPGIGITAGYGISRRFSLQCSYDHFQYSVKHTDIRFGDRTSPHDSFLLGMKYNLGGARVGSYLLAGAGFSFSRVHFVTVIIGQEPVFERYTEGHLLFSPGFGFQYRLKPRLTAFAECRLNFVFSYISGLRAIDYVYGEIPVKVGLTYHL